MHSSSPVINFALFDAVKFGKRAVKTGRDKNRVVTKTGIPAFMCSNLTVYTPFKRLIRTIGAGKYNDTGKMSRPVLRISFLQFLEQFVHAEVEISIRRISGRINAGTSADCIDA